MMPPTTKTQILAVLNTSVESEKYVNGDNIGPLYEQLIDGDTLIYEEAPISDENIKISRLVLLLVRRTIMTREDGGFRKRPSW